MEQSKNKSNKTEKDILESLKIASKIKQKRKLLNHNGISIQRW